MTVQEELIIKVTVSKKIKTVDNKIEQNKAQHNFDRQTANISALSAGNFSKYEFLTGKDFLSEKDLLEKATTMKRLEYMPLGKESKAQTDIEKKQCQGSNKAFICVKDNTNVNESLTEKEKKKIQ